MSHHSPGGTDTSQCPRPASPEPPPSPAQELFWLSPGPPPCLRHLVGSTWICHPSMGNPFGVPGQKEPEEGSGEAEGDGGTSFTLITLARMWDSWPSQFRTAFLAKTLNRAWAEWWGWVFVQPGAPSCPASVRDWLQEKQFREKR